jgi:hypothetical protein
MKSIKALEQSALLVLVCVLARSECGAQGTFQNLDFESANVTSLPPRAREFVSSLDALPAWTAYLGSSPMSEVLHNGFTLGTASVSIFGPNLDPAMGGAIIGGRYSAALQAGDLNGVGLSASIVQFGVVPASAQSIQVSVNPLLGDYTLALWFGTQRIPLAVLSQRGDTLRLGGDITGYAGKSEELRLSALNTPSTPFGSLVVDDIVFSNQRIPEPPAILLALAGLLALVCLRRGRW